MVNSNSCFLQCKFQDTPITDIFGGTMLFIRTAGKDTNQTRQPFFSLKLDIQVGGAGFKRFMISDSFLLLFPN